MKTKLYLLMLFALAISGCIKSDADNYYTHYIYDNTTSDAITIESFSRKYSDTTTTTRDTSFIIKPGNEFELVLGGGDETAHPFKFPNTLIKDRFMTYSNGKKTFTQEIDGKYKNPLYHWEGYEQMERANRDVYYRYVFTDQDFEDTNAE